MRHSRKTHLWSSVFWFKTYSWQTDANSIGKCGETVPNHIRHPLKNPGLMPSEGWTPPPRHWRPSAENKWSWQAGQSGNMNWHARPASYGTWMPLSPVRSNRKMFGHPADLSWWPLTCVWTLPVSWSHKGKQCSNVSGGEFLVGCGGIRILNSSQSVLRHSKKYFFVRLCGDVQRYQRTTANASQSFSKCSGLVKTIASDTQSTQSQWKRTRDRQWLRQCCNFQCERYNMLPIHGLRAPGDTMSFIFSLNFNAGRSRFVEKIITGSLGI